MNSLTVPVGMVERAQSPCVGVTQEEKCLLSARVNMVVVTGIPAWAVVPSQ